MNRSVGQTTFTLKRAAFLVSFLCIAAQAIFAQPVVDSIRYNEPDQSIIIVYLNEEVTYTPSSPAATSDWVVYHNGVAYPAVYLNARGVLDPPNIIRLTVDAAITYSEAHTGTGITVEYLGTGPAITGTSGTLAAFGPTDAINNLPMECEMFDPSRFDYSLSLTEICAPASVEYTTAFYVQRHYINSIYYDPNRINLITRWGDGDVDEIPGAEVSPGKFQYTFSHTYPDNPSVCYWESFLLPSITGIGSCTGGGLRKTFVYENHATDEEGDGILRFHTDTIRVCLGQDVNEIFTDATYFNCNPQTEPDFANDGMRAVRFTYGTNVSPEPRIQDIYVDGNLLVPGTPITGPIVYYDSIRSTGVPAPSGWSVSDPISHAFNAGTDLIGQVFEIQMENWGPCNSILLNEPPIITYAYIKFVQGPIANPGPDFTICADASATMAGAIEQTSTGGFWSTNTGDGTWTNPEQPSGAEYTPGPDDLVNGGVWLVLTADDGAGGCPEHQDSMYLSIEPELLPGNIAASQLLCQDDDAAAFTSTAPATGGVAPTYHWYTSTAEAGPYTEMAGENGPTIDEGVLPVGNYYYFRQARSAGVCAPVNTDTLSIIVNPGPPPAPLNPVNDSPVCEDGTVTVDVDDAPTAAEYTWDVSWDGVADDEDTVTTVSEVSFDLTGVAPGTYTVKVRASNICGNSPWSVTTTVLIHPTPNALPTPPSQTIADSATADILMDGDVAGTLFSWRVLDAGTTSATDGGPLNIGESIQQTLYNTTTAPVTVIYRIGPSANGCLGDSADAEVIIAPFMDMTVVNNSPDICTGSSTDIEVSSNVDGATFSWTVTDPNGLGANTGTDVGPNTGITIQDNLVNTSPEIDSVIYHITPTGPAPADITGATQNIKVYVYPDPEAVPVNHLDSICDGLQTDIEMAADVAGSTFTWTVNDPGGTTGATASGSAVSEGYRIRQILDNPGNAPITVEYIITPTGPLPGNCPGDPVTVKVVVNPTPDQSVIMGNENVCAYSTHTYSVPDNPGSTYQWYIPQGAWFATDPTLHEVEVTFGLFSGHVRVTEITPSGCATNHITKDITVSPVPAATLNADKPAICEGELVTFTAGPVSDVSNYEFFLNGTSVQSGPGNTWSSATLANDDTVMVNVTSTNGCEAFAPPVIMSVQPEPTVTLTSSEVVTICAGEATQFRASASGSDLVFQWMVSTDGGSNWTALSDNDVYDGTGTDQLWITNSTPAMSGNLYRLDVSSSCAPTATDEVELTVWGNPTANITGDLNDFPQLCGGELLTLDGNPAGGSGTYTTHRWSGDVNYVTSVNQQTAEFRTYVKGDFKINYTVTDDRGCSGRDTVVLQNFSPTAEFTSDAAPSCGDLTVNFTNRSSTDAVSFDWDFDNGATSTEKHPSQLFENNDPTGLVAYYNVLMVATDAAGCNDTARSLVTIYPEVDPELTATPQSGCQPLEVLLETKPGVASYLWDFGDGTGVSGSYTTYHLYANLGITTRTFETVLQTTSAYGCVATDTVEIVVDPIPQPNFSASPAIQTIPESGSAQVTFTNLTTDGPWTFEYDFGDGSENYTTTSFADVEHTYDAAGIYTVTLYTSVGACIDSASTVVTINPRPPVASFTSITEGCHPLEVVFTNTSKHADSYTWQFGDGSVSTEEHPVHVFYQPGEYTVKLFAKGPGGTDQASVVITVNPTPQVFFNHAPDSVFVNDKPVRFFNLTSYADDYYWDFGDVSEFDGEVDSENNSTLADPTHVYMFEGWKDVLLIGSNPHCVDSLFIPMAVKVIPAGVLQFPTVFRPGDSPVSGVNVNDLADGERNTVFFPGVNRQVQEYHLYIYNRWGELIFESEDINTGWDGFVQGQKAAQGVYIWKVTGIYSNGSPFSEAGDVTLLWRRVPFQE